MPVQPAGKPRQQKTGKKRANPEAMKIFLEKMEKVNWLILDSMFDMVEIFGGPECKRIWANKAAIAASGLSRKRFFSTPCHKIWWRRDTPCDPCPNRWVMETGKPYQSQARTPDGKWWHFRCSPIWDESKTLIGVVQVSCNITDNKRAQQALATSEARFRFIFNSAPVGICHYNPKGIITECNPQFAKIVGTPPERLIGFNLLKSLTNEYLLRAVRGALSGKPGHAEGKYTSITGGKTAYGKIDCIPLFSGEKTIAGGVCVVEDITRRIEAEKALKKSEAEARALLNATTDAAILLDHEGIILDANDAYARRFNQTKEKILGTRLWAIYPPEVAENRKMAIEEVMKSGKPLTLVDEREGRWYHANIFPIFSTAGQVTRIAIFAHDITREKKAEEDLIKSQEQLRKLSTHLQFTIEKERADVAREIHDDLGQILTVLKMDAAWLKEKLPKGEKALIKKAQAIMEAADGGIRSVQQVVSQLRPALLDDLGLDAAIEYMAIGCQQRTGIRFDIRVKAEEVRPAPETATAVFRIFQEAVTNIARHSRATRVKVRLTVQDGVLELVVSDNGIGITPEHLADHGAFGLLGMRERARAIGGSFEISGISGKGTRIAVRIPNA